MNCYLQFIYCDFTVTTPLFCTWFFSGVLVLLSLNLMHVMEPFVYLQNLLKTLKLSGNSIMVLTNYGIRPLELMQ